MFIAIERELQRFGFDLCHPMHTSWYNNLVKSEGLVESGTLQTLPEPPCATSEGEDNNGCIKGCNAVLVGNTKKIWPVFLKWLASEIDQRRETNLQLVDGEALSRMKSPFDTFVAESIVEALRRTCQNNKELISYELFWSNGNRQKINCDKISTDCLEDGGGCNIEYHCYDGKKDSFLVSMQRVATTTGEYWHDDEATKLCVHPEYGTWTAFRTVVVFETKRHSSNIPLVPSPCPCPVTVEERELAKTIFNYALEMSSSDEQGYGATLDKSWEQLCKYLHSAVCSGSKLDDVPASMKPWIQLRDCINVGKSNWRYSEAQLLYHYTKNPEILCLELRRMKVA